MEIIYSRVAGIDVGKKEVAVAVAVAVRGPGAGLGAGVLRVGQVRKFTSHAESLSITVPANGPRAATGITVLTQTTSK